MADRTFPADEVTAAFRQVSHWWKSLVGAIDDGVWDQAALGEWSVRELVAHTNRAYRTIPLYLEGEVKDDTWIPTAAAYYRTVLAEETPHVHIAARAKIEADQRGDWVEATAQMAERAERLVATTAEDATVHLFVGEMALDQYLATRVLELVVHGLDLAAAIDFPSPAPPTASRLAINLLLDLAAETDHTAVLRMLTGRPASLPLTNVLD